MLSEVGRMVRCKIQASEEMSIDLTADPISFALKPGSTESSCFYFLKSIVIQSFGFD
jgi:hypothetical protein